MDRALATIALLVLIVFAGPLKATTVEDWALCNNCTTQAQFEAAAVAWVGNRMGTFEVEVGNIYTSKVYRVSVTTNPYPSNPAGEDPGEGFELQSGHQVVELPSAPPSLVVSGDAIPSSYATINHTMEEPHEVQDQFHGVVVLFGKQPLIAPGPKIPGLGSFGTRWDTSVCNVVNNALTAMNPAWQAGQISPPSLGKLFGALTYFFGRGPTAHVVFNNGDVASFQANPLSPSACRYLDGTAQDRDGNPLSEEGGIPGNSGGGVTVVPHPGSGQVHYGSGSYWMVCSFQGDVLLECYVQYVPE